MEEGREEGADLPAEYKSTASLVSSVVEKRECQDSEEYELGVGKSTVRRHHRAAKYEYLEKELYDFHVQAVIANLPITDIVLKEQADKIAIRQKICNFESSSGWLGRFMKRYNIKVEDLTVGSPVAAKRRRRRDTHKLTMLEKMQLLRDVDEKIGKKCEIAAAYNIPQSTLSSIVRNRDRLEKFVRDKISLSSKRLMGGSLEDLEQELFEFYDQTTRDNMLPVTSDMIKEQADNISVQLNIKGFESSNVWLSRFMKRFNISTLSGKKREYQNLTMLEKMELLREIDEKKGNTFQIAAKYRIPVSTLSMIVKNRDSLKIWPWNGRESNEIISSSTLDQLSMKLYNHCTQLASAGLPFTGTMLKNRANELAKELGLDDFLCSSSWLSRFKKQFDIDYSDDGANTWDGVIMDTETVGEIDDVLPAKVEMDFGPWEGITNFSDCCRLCLTKSDYCNLTEIFAGTSATSESWVQKISSLIPIELHQVDGLPQGVCSDCVDQLAQAHAFIATAVSVDNWLRCRPHTVELKEEDVDSEVEFLPPDEKDPLAFEQYIQERPIEHEVWGNEADADGEVEPFLDYQDDESADESYVNERPKRKRGRPPGVKPKKKTTLPPVAEPIPDAVKRKRGRPRRIAPQPETGSVAPPVGNEDSKCRVGGGDIKFDARGSATKYIRKGNRGGDTAAKSKVTDDAQNGAKDADAGADLQECQQRCNDGRATVDGVEGLTTLLETKAEVFDKPAEATKDDDDCREEVAGSSEEDDPDPFGDKAASQEDGDPKVYNCAECGKKFKSYESMKRHMRYHTEKDRYPCDLCQLSFCNQMGLVDHYRTHTNDRPFACTNCPKTFKVKVSLAKHQRTHTGERPYSCIVCSKKFSLLCVLRNHERIHTGEKPFTCTLCPKTFAAHTGRARHMRSHTGEKPFACQFCELSFAAGHRRNLHERRAHANERSVKCTACDEKFADAEKQALHFADVHEAF